MKNVVANDSYIQGMYSTATDVMAEQILACDLPFVGNVDAAPQPSSSRRAGRNIVISATLLPKMALIYHLLHRI